MLNAVSPFTFGEVLAMLAGFFLGGFAAGTLIGYSLGVQKSGFGRRLNEMYGREDAPR
jgi:hypothetical protein